MKQAKTLVMPTEAELQAQGEAMRALWRGHWRQWAERNLVVEDKYSRRIVPFVFNPTQQLLHRLLFEPLDHYTKAMRGVVVKDRQATVSSFAVGMEFSMAFNVPGIHAVHTFQDERTGDMLKKRVDLSWNRLAWWQFEKDGVIIHRLSDRKDYLEIGFFRRQDGDPRVDAGVRPYAVSSLTIVSAGAEEFGPGIAPNIVVFDEYDKYESLRLVADIEDGLAANAWVLKISTPEGMKQLYTDYWAAKNGESGDKAVCLVWFMNPENAIAAGPSVAPPRFQEDFALLPEHRAIVESPEWERYSALKDRVQDAFRWWEWERQKVRQLLAAQGEHDERMVLARMEQEHCSSDRDCWMNFARIPFDKEMLSSMTRDAAQNPPKVTRDIAPNLTLRVWQGPRTGMTYAAPMDCSEGYKTGDPIAALWWDADGNIVASVHGRCDLEVATNKILELCEWYNAALFSPEVDGGWGHFAASVALRRGYRRIWKRPPKPASDPAKPVQFDPDRYGWRTQGHKEEMKQAGIAAFNGGRVRVWDMGLLRDMANFDPESVKHTSDRLMAFFIGAMITNPDTKFGRQFWQMAHGGTPAARAGAAQQANGMHIIPTHGGFRP